MGLLDDTSQQPGLLNDSQHFYRADVPDWLQYFTEQWLHNNPNVKMNYLEGRGSDTPQTTNYNVPLAYLNNMKQAIQWEDQGPAGARWHGYSTTPGGQDLKEPWHPTHWMNDYLTVQNQLNKALTDY